MNVFYKNREQLIEDVKTIGQTIIDRAEDIVGDWSYVQTYTITAEISADSLPLMKWTKGIILRKLDTKAEVIQ